MKSHLPRVVSISLLFFRGRKKGKRKKEAVVLNHLETDKQQDCAPFNPTNRFFLLRRFILLIDERDDARHSKKGEGHKSRQLKKSCWLFKTSTPTQTEMKILYRGETLEYLLTFSFLLSSVLFLFFYIFFSRSPLSPPFSFSGIFLEKGGRKGKRQSLCEIVSLECKRRAREN